MVGATEHNLKDLTVDFPLGHLHRGHRSVGLGQVDPGPGHPLRGTPSEDLPVPGGARAGTSGSTASSTSTRSSTSTSRRSAAPPAPTPPPTPGSGTTSDRCSAATPEARARGYLPGRFSFNVKGGRCEACAGDGTIKIEMHFLPDVYVPCEVCRGARYNRETLEILWKGHSIAEVLDMSVEEALAVFANQPKIVRVLADAVRCRPGLHPARTVGDDPFRWRGPADQACLRARHAIDRTHLLHPRRADHRPPLRGHPQAAPGPAAPGRCRQHRGRDRAQPRCDQVGRLGHRPRPRRRRRGRARSSPRARPRTLPRYPRATPASFSAN